MMTTDNRRIRSTEELAFANINGSSETRLEYQKHRMVKLLSEALGARWLTEQPEMQRQINAAMEGAIADTRRPNPITGGPSSPTARPLDAAPVQSGPSGNGWRDTGLLRPVATPLAEAVIAAMAHQALPMGQGNSEFKGKKEDDATATNPHPNSWAVPNQ
jgi:hypothetical protein